MEFAREEKIIQTAKAIAQWPLNPNAEIMFASREKIPVNALRTVAGNQHFLIVITAQYSKMAVFAAE